jgi:predicted polyphosphate/ATP-dependent NAD kinase
MKATGAHESAEEIEARPDALFLLGPGSSVQAVSRALNIDKTLLGIDAIAHGRIVVRDLAEQSLLKLFARYGERKLILNPIGAQGFVLGRGNQPLSPAVIRLMGMDNMILIATPAKLVRTPLLRVDTGDAALDAQLISRKFLPVVIGYHRMRLLKIAA